MRASLCQPWGSSPLEPDTNTDKMAPSQEQVKTIGQLRQHLSQLSVSIQSLRTSLEFNDPLPSWLVFSFPVATCSFGFSNLLSYFSMQVVMLSG